MATVVIVTYGSVNMLIIPMRLSPMLQLLLDSFRQRLATGPHHPQLGCGTLPLCQYVWRCDFHAAGQR
eukprot:1934219-Pyramimonas_sp.AAC.2